EEISGSGFAHRTSSVARMKSGAVSPHFAALMRATITVVTERNLFPPVQRKRMEGLRHANQPRGANLVQPNVMPATQFEPLPRQSFRGSIALARVHGSAHWVTEFGRRMATGDEQQRGLDHARRSS